MRLRILALVVLSASSAFLVAQSPYEDILKGMLESLERTTAALGKVQDADSAKETAPELKKTAVEFAELRAKAAKLEPPSRAEKDRIAKEFRVKFEESRKKLIAEIERVKRTPGGKEVLSEIRGILERDAK